MNTCPSSGNVLLDAHAASAPHTEIVGNTMPNVYATLLGNITLPPTGITAEDPSKEWQSPYNPPRHKPGVPSKPPSEPNIPKRPWPTNPPPQKPQEEPQQEPQKKPQS